MTHIILSFNKTQLVRGSVQTLFFYEASFENDTIFV